MVITPPTTLDSSIFEDGISLTQLRQSSPARTSSESSPRSVVEDSTGGPGVNRQRLHIRFRAQSTDSNESVDTSPIDPDKEYDFNVDRTAARRLGVRGGVGALVKGCLGCGITSIHESYMVCGLWTALLVNMLLGVLLTYCMYGLTVSMQKMYARLRVPSLSYPELAEAILDRGPFKKLCGYGRCFRYMVEVFICINSLGGCAAYQTIMARQLKQLVDGSEGLTHMWPTVRLYIAILLLPCLLISTVTDMRHLAPFSIVLDFFILMLCVSTMWYSALAATISPLKMPFYRSLDGLLELVGVAMFSMDGVAITLAVENSLQNPKTFPLVLVIGMLIVVSLVMLSGAFGYWGYGDSSLAPITINFCWGQFSVQLKMFLIIMTYVSFALNFWVPSNMIWYYISRMHQPDHHWAWERLYRMLMVLCTSAVAVLMPCVAAFMALIGSFCISVLAFIFPALIGLITEWGDHGPGKCYWRLWKASFFVLLGLTLCVTGTYTNVRQLGLHLTNRYNNAGMGSY